MIYFVQAASASAVQELVDSEEEGSEVKVIIIWIYYKKLLSFLKLKEI